MRESEVGEFPHPGCSNIGHHSMRICAAKIRFHLDRCIKQIVKKMYVKMVPRYENPINILFKN
uniref:Uncharacterized protein n=1 Tax=Aegilops tauschii subsp. strangulata TaxID=200361 RepID=A0A453N8W9_AEGTS